MGARIIECMIAIWLALSPFIFHYPPEETFFWVNNFGCAFFVSLFALLSFWYPLRNIHLLTIVIALWSWGIGYSTFPEPTSAPLENSVVVGLILLMLAIIPSHSAKLSHSWEVFMKRNASKTNESAEG